MVVYRPMWTYSDRPVVVVNRRVLKFVVPLAKAAGYMLAIMVAVWGGFVLFAVIGWPGWSE